MNTTTGSSPAAVHTHEGADATVGAGVETIKKVMFHFKKDKETGIKRESVELPIPVPTTDDIITWIQADSDELALLHDAIFNVIYEQAREVVNNQLDISAENFDAEAVSWTTIAHLPPAARKGAGIAKEIWEAFATDYVEVMVAKAGKTMDKAKTAADLLVKKFQPVKTNKPIVQVLRDYLSVWFANSANAEDFQSVFEFLDNKAKALLEADENALLNNL